MDRKYIKAWMVGFLCATLAAMVSLWVAGHPQVVGKLTGQAVWAAIVFVVLSKTKL